MTSERKRAANRENSLHSTGPQTPAGKARVSQNAIQHDLPSRRWFPRQICHLMEHE
jgi:hypothetical protein